MWEVIGYFIGFILLCLILSYDPLAHNIDGPDFPEEQ